MSQPLPPQPGEKDDPGPPLEGAEELVAYLAAGEKPRDAFKIGTEHEKFGFLRDTKAPLPYAGDRGIEGILDAIAALSEAEGDPYTRIFDGPHVVALVRGRESITLEPGGQLELSGAPLTHIHETCEEVGRHLSLLKKVCIERGIGFIGIGFHPTARWADMPAVPKSRYGIMERYMPTRGRRGLDMMKRTCTVQANFDYASEDDMVKTCQTALRIAPLATALFANSPFVDGKPTGRQSERAFVWTDTDPDRCGFPAVMLADDFNYEKYIEYALDVPMYFIRRDGVHHDHAGASFRDFMTHGLDGYRATMRDFEDHLTCAFPEVRLKQYLEVRSADCGPWSRICALPALYKGILYDEAAREAANALLDGATNKELTTLHRDVANLGFKAAFRGRSVLTLVEELVDLSSDGLERIQKRNRGPKELHFIKPLVDAVSQGRTFADDLLHRYHHQWGDSLEPLWDAIEFFDDEEETKLRASAEGRPVD